MFDNISFRIENFSKEKFYNFTTNFVEEIPRDLGDYYDVFWHNLRIKFYKISQKLFVSNSIHKFYNAEFNKVFNNNWDKFTIENLQKTIKLLSEALGVESSDMKIYGRFEFGFNVNTYPLKPYQDIIQRFESVVNTTRNPFDVFPNPNGKPFGKTCSFCDYKMKLYDKGKECGNPRKSILRYEISNQNILNTRKILKIPTPTMSDLLDVKFGTEVLSML